MKNKLSSNDRSQARRGPKPLAGPTPAQARALSAIRALTRERGVPPTVQEIASALGIRGASVHEQIGKMAEKGLVRRSPGKARTLAVVEPPASLRAASVNRPAERGAFTVPLAGSSVAAGFPSPADDYVEGPLDLNAHLVKNPAATFFVRVEGVSMVGAGIHPGDILVVDRSREPVSGDIVIAVAAGELTVKRLRRREGRVFLAPENPDYPLLEITEEMEAVVWGVVTSCVHSF